MSNTKQNSAAITQIKRLNGATWKIERLSESNFAIWMPARNSKSGYRLYAYKNSEEQAAKTVYAAKMEF